MPTQVTNYQCPACTGPLHFVGASGKLECDYCGSTYDVAEIEALYAEKEAKAAETQQQEEQKQTARKQAAADNGWDTSDMSDDWGDDADAMRAYSCPSCGAELLCDEIDGGNQLPLLRKSDGRARTVLRRAEAGHYVLPFKLAKEDAVEALKAHYKGKPLPAEARSRRENHVRGDSRASTSRSGCSTARPRAGPTTRHPVRIRTARATMRSRETEHFRRLPRGYARRLRRSRSMRRARCRTTTWTRSSRLITKS